MSLAEKFEVIADSVYEKGKEKERSNFWDVFQNKGKLNAFSSYQYAFSYGHWTDNNYNPKYTISAGYSCSYMYYMATSITDTKVDIDLRYAPASLQVFRSSGLKTIRKLIVAETNTYNTWFKDCAALENITFEGVIGNDLSFADCPLLTVESMLNIFGCLRDNSATGASNTLTLGSTNLNKLTDEQKVIATEKGWTLA